MKIIVLSYHKGEDTYVPFYGLMEKYYPNHPEIIYFTDGNINPFYKTIPVETKIDKWTVGFREFLRQVDDKQVLLMIDDCFIRKPVDEKRIEMASTILGANMYFKGNIAMLNFEQSWDENDEETKFDGWKKRKHGSEFEVSLMCGLWDKEKLLKVVERDCSPWEIELNQDGCGFDYLINSGDWIIDWGYRTFQPVGKVKGEWTEETIKFLESEGYHVGI